MQAHETHRSRSILAGVLCLLAGFCAFHFHGNATRGYIDTRSLFVWWGTQWFDPRSETQHGPLIVVTALWLWWRNLHRFGVLSPLAVARDATWGGALMLLGLGVHLLGYASQQSRLSIAAWLLFLAGAVRLLGGRRWGAAAVFPLALLVLAVPVNFLESLGFHLRLAVSITAESVAHLAGIEVVRNGTQLFAPDGRFQYDVAAACSGVRSLVALFGLGVVIAYLNFGSNLARWLVAGLTFPFAFLGNALRILAIVFAGEYFGHEAGARVHSASGVLVFVVVLGLLLAFTGVAVKRWKWRPPVPRPPNGAFPPRAARATAFGVALLVAAAAAGAGWAVLQLDARNPGPRAGVRLADDGVDPAPLPEFLGTEWIGQRVEVTAVEREVLPPDTGYSRRNYVSVADRADQVFFSVVLSGKDRTSIHRPELCVVGQGWSIAAEKRHTFVLPDGTRVEATLLELAREVVAPSGERQQVTHALAYWFVSADAQAASHSAMLWQNAASRLRHLRADRWAYIVVQTPMGDAADAALKRMEEVVAEVWPAIRTGSRLDSNDGVTS